MKLRPTRPLRWTTCLAICFAGESPRKKRKGKGAKGIWLPKKAVVSAIDPAGKEIDLESDPDELRGRIVEQLEIEPWFARQVPAALRKPYRPPKTKPTPPAKPVGGRCIPEDYVDPCTCEIECPPWELCPRQGKEGV